jgi:hypothetical protein
MITSKNSGELLVSEINYNFEIYIDGLNVQCKEEGNVYLIKGFYRNIQGDLFFKNTLIDVKNNKSKNILYNYKDSSSTKFVDMKLTTESVIVTDKANFDASYFIGTDFSGISYVNKKGKLIIKENDNTANFQQQINEKWLIDKGYVKVEL